MGFEKAHQGATTLAGALDPQMLIKKSGGALGTVLHAGRFADEPPERAAASHHIRQAEAARIVNDRLTCPFNQWHRVRGIASGRMLNAVCHSCIVWRLIHRARLAVSRFGRNGRSKKHSRM
jgi:hypothetical protein